MLLCVSACVALYGVSLFVLFVWAYFYVFACFACDILCDVVWCVYISCVCVCVNLFVWCVYDLWCAVVWFVFRVGLYVCARGLRCVLCVKGCVMFGVLFLCVCVFFVCKLFGCGVCASLCDDVCCFICVLCVCVLG